MCNFEKIKIRRMKSCDFKSVHKLVEQVYMLHLKNRRDIYRDEDPLYRNDFENFLNNSNCWCYVAELDNNIVGEIFATIKEIKEEGIFKKRKILFIEDICVDSQYTNEGIGKMLYNKVKENAIKNDVNSIELNVWFFNESAIQFYNKLGLTCKSMRFENRLK